MAPVSSEFWHPVTDAEILDQLCLCLLLEHHQGALRRSHGAAVGDSEMHHAQGPLGLYTRRHVQQHTIGGPAAVESDKRIVSAVGECCEVACNQRALGLIGRGKAHHGDSRLRAQARERRLVTSVDEHQPVRFEPVDERAGLPDVRGARRQGRQIILFGQRVERGVLPGFGLAGRHLATQPRGTCRAALRLQPGKRCGGVEQLRRHLLIKYTHQATSCSIQA